nr:MAG TPA: hypothetical protein [Caudoviricetes sp.]
MPPFLLLKIAVSSIFSSVSAIFLRFPVFLYVFRRCFVTSWNSVIYLRVVPR